MSLTRRRVVSSLTLAGAAAFGAGAGCSREALNDGEKSNAHLGLSRELPYPAGPFVNRDRATKIMHDLGLDGLVYTGPESLYWLTGYDNPMLGGSLYHEVRGAAYAILPKDRRLPVALVMDSFAYYYHFSNSHRGDEVLVYQFTAVPDASEASDNSAVLATGLPPLQSGEPVLFPDRGAHPLSEIEKMRGERVAQQMQVAGMYRSEHDALSAAIEDSRLSTGRIAVDFPMTSAESASLSDAAPAATLTSAARASALIRLVKSEKEIELMRVASVNNAEAALQACRTVAAGATYRELRSTFFSEAAARGSLGTWIIIDHLKSDLVEAQFQRGQAFCIDAVSTFLGYWGDYGRTVCIGEPTTSMKRHTEAIGFAWNVIRENLGPGIRFSEIQRLGAEALRRGNFDTPVRFTPHSIGLTHTDATGVGDIVLEPGMIISVDCPVLEAGAGGTAHLEDLTLITADGHEMLNDTGDQLVIV